MEVDSAPAWRRAKLPHPGSRVGLAILIEQANISLFI
jgi:hypothetical protein